MKPIKFGINEMDAAKLKANQLSEKDHTEDYHVIEDHGQKSLYVDTSGFIRVFETLHFTYRDGKEIYPEG